MFVPPPEMVVIESSHWRVNQRVDVRLPGYLMVAPKVPAAHFGELDSEAAAEMGLILQKVARAMEELLRPQHLYVCRFGHTIGHSLHFHLIPVYDWLAEAFLEDARYRFLRQFDTPGVSNSGHISGFDGSEMTLFIWREYAEGAKPLPENCPSMMTVLERLRNALR